MPRYSSEEYANIIMAYGAAHSNAREARRIYQERYPNSRLPDRDTFAATYRWLRETDNLNARGPRGGVRQLPVAIDEQILAAFERDPTTSTRVVAAALGVSQWKVWSVMRQDNQHPYHYTPVQGLEVTDFQRRPKGGRSPDLTPLDFHVWGRTKEIVYSGEMTITKEELIEKINNAFTIMKGEVRLSLTTSQVRKRFRACIRNHGQQFEQNH